MKRVIVNADDFGLSPEVNRGIIEAHRDGLVTAATCLVGMPSFREVVEERATFPSLDLGVHLNLTWGRPASKESLPRLAPDGRFASKKKLALRLLLRRVGAAEVAAEFRAQVRAFQSELGNPSHLDVHQHFQVFPIVWAALVDVAREFAVPFIRLPAAPPRGSVLVRAVAKSFRNRARPSPLPHVTDHFEGLAETGKLTEAALERILNTAKDGLTEVMVHPGAQSRVEGIPDRLARSRDAERESLTSARMREVASRSGIHLTTFAAEATTIANAALLR